MLWLGIQRIQGCLHPLEMTEKSEYGQEILLRPAPLLEKQGSRPMAWHEQVPYDPHLTTRPAPFNPSLGTPFPGFRSRISQAFPFRSLLVAIALPSLFYIGHRSNRSIKRLFVLDPLAFLPSSHGFINCITGFPFIFSLGPRTGGSGNGKGGTSFFVSCFGTILSVITHHIGKFSNPTFF